MANAGRNGRRVAAQREMLVFDALPRAVRDLLNYAPRQPTYRDVTRLPHLIRRYGEARVVSKLRELSFADQR